MSRHRRRSLALLGVALALLAVAVLGPGGGRGEAPAAQARVQVVVVRRPLRAGQRLVATDLAVRRVVLAAASPHQLSDPSAAVGRRVAVALGAGSPLMDAELAGDAAPARSRDVPLRLDDAAGLPAGDLAGARADVYLLRPGAAARPELVLAGAWVVSAGERDGALSATLRVPARVVAGLIAAEAHGSLRLVARPLPGADAG